MRQPMKLTLLYSTYQGYRKLPWGYVLKSPVVQSVPVNNCYCSLPPVGRVQTEPRYSIGRLIAPSNLDIWLPTGQEWHWDWLDVVTILKQRWRGPVIVNKQAVIQIEIRFVALVLVYAFTIRSLKLSRGKNPRCHFLSLHRQRLTS